MIDKDHILSEIKRTAEENGGKPLGRERFQKETRIKLHDWYGVYWIKWSDALHDAGFESNTFQKAYGVDFLMSFLIKLIEELNRFPTLADIRMKSRNDSSFPCHSTFQSLGSKEKRIQKVLRYAEKNSASDSVIAACQSALDLIPKTKTGESSTHETFGFVYLMKSGKHYKIGRSNCAERREYELKILLPEDLELVHKIKTDDPVGIEKYWHERFKDKRKGGEWFELMASDIKAFKLRKFM
jgi:hypothetical protein